jgi:hypothetical protein
MENKKGSIKYSRSASKIRLASHCTGQEQGFARGWTPEPVGCRLPRGAGLLLAGELLFWVMENSRE